MLLQTREISPTKVRALFTLLCLLCNLNCGMDGTVQHADYYSTSWMRCRDFGPSQTPYQVVVSEIRLYRTGHVPNTGTYTVLPVRSFDSECQYCTATYRHRTLQ